jgi:hypothetical protein
MLRSDLAARLRTPRFWTDYLHVTQPDWPETSSLTWEVPLDLGTPVGLDLVIDYGTSGATLLLHDAREDAVPIEVAWDDQAHWHPHVLRWPELDAICNRIVGRSKAYPHPGVPLLLLYRFAPLVSDAEYQRYVPTLERAWGELGLFGPSDTAAFIDRVDFRNQFVEWQYSDGVGWTVEQTARAERDLYSLRVLGNSEFPFVPWNSLMSELAEAGAVP